MKLLFSVPSLFIVATLLSHGALVMVESTSNVGPGHTISDNSSTTTIPSVVDFDGFFFDVYPSPGSVPGVLNSADGPFGENRLFFREAEAGSVPDPAGTRTGVIDASTMFVGTTNTEFYRVAREGPVISGPRQGAVLGDDNWVYFSNNDNPGAESPSFWAQINLTTNSATPIRYVHNPTEPFADITLQEAVGVPEPGSVVLFALGAAFFLRRRR